MNIKSHGLSLAFIALVLGPFAVSGCDQVRTQCILGPAESQGYAVVYKLKSQKGTCPALPKGGTIGMEDFHPLKPGSVSVRVLTQTTIAIQTQELFGFANDYVAGCLNAPDPDGDRKSTRLNSSHPSKSRMPSSA